MVYQTKRMKNKLFIKGESHYHYDIVVHINIFKHFQIKSKKKRKKKIDRENVISYLEIDVNNYLKRGAVEL